MITFYVALTLLLAPPNGVYTYKDYDSPQTACENAVGDVISEVSIIPFSITACCQKRGDYFDLCTKDPYTYDCDFSTSHKSKTLKCKMTLIDGKYYDYTTEEAK